MLKGSGNTQVNPWQWHENLPEADRQALGEALASLNKNPAVPALLPADILMSQGKANTYTESPKMTLWEQFKHMVKTGGVFMWPLLAIPIIVIYLFGLKIFVVMGRRGGSKKQFEAILELAKSGKIRDAEAEARKVKGSLVAMTMGAVAGIAEAGRGAAEKAIKELLLFEVPRLERHLTTLSVLAAAAPLLGLLGTVSGLITMFQVITEHGVNDPKLLAGGIGEALIATETGLLVAIPTLMGHNWLANRVDQTVADSEAYGHKLLNTLWPEGKA